MQYLCLVKRATLVILCSLLWISIAVAASSPEIIDSEPALISLTINSQTSGQSVLALKAQNSQWWLPVEALRSANVAVEISQIRLLNNTPYVSVASLPVSELEFDESTQSLRMW